VIVAVPVAAAVWLAADARGAYEIGAWAPLGLLVLAAALVLSVGGRFPSRRAAAPAAALVALGAWAAASAAWGGVPAAGWTSLDQLIVAATALAVGAMLASAASRRQMIHCAVLAGIIAHAVDLMVRLAFSQDPLSYFHGRVLYGLVGYQNAQAAILAIGVPPALALTTHDRRLRRAAGASAAVLLCAGVLLTESRGGLLALAFGVLVQVAWSRDRRVTANALLSLTATATLFVQLRHVDRALLVGVAGPAVRTYVMLAVAASVAAAALTQLSVPRSLQRGLVATGSATACALAIAGALTVGPRLSPAWTQLTADVPPNPPAGSTRLVSLSLNGRADAWRVAAAAFAEHPFGGGGAGTFSVRWTEERRLSGLYILQPHSIELELLSELGLVGLALFGAFAALAYRGVATAGRRDGAVAGGVLSIVLLQASYDWTWSFPGLLAPACVVVGAACGGGIVRRRAVPATLVAAAFIVVGSAAIAVPYLSHRQADAARRLQATDLRAAWAHALAATHWDPWDADARSTKAAIAAAAGQYALAARTYHEAGDLALQPWADYYREAEAWQRAGADDRRLAACRAARTANPLEPMLEQGVCG